MNARMTYKAHNQYALTMNATSRTHFKGDMGLLYDQTTRLSNLGMRGCFSAVHFFYIGGILSLPYQFYHHAHKMLCDHGQIFFFFVSDTDPAVGPCLIALAVLHAVPRCVYPLPDCPCGNHDPYAEYTVQL